MVWARSPPPPAGSYRVILRLLVAKTPGIETQSAVSGVHPRESAQSAVKNPISAGPILPRNYVRNLSQPTLVFYFLRKT